VVAAPPVPSIFDLRDRRSCLNYRVARTIIHHRPLSPAMAWAPSGGMPEQALQSLAIFAKAQASRKGPRGHPL
jgi:hypothetical protein